MASSESEVHLFLANQIKFEECLRQSSDVQEQKKLIRRHIEFVLTSTPILLDLRDCEFINCEQTSQVRNFSDCIVVADFFTYCCINCLHILPILKKLESEYSHKALAVVGVHSPKFENEKLSSHVKDAIEKYTITHPVINDANGRLWTQMAISCWPTVLILGPGDKVFFYLIGENNIADWLNLYCEIIYDFFHEKGHLSNKLEALSLKSTDPQRKTTLHFPGKISASPHRSLIAISDSGNNRIVVTDINGEVKFIIGSAECGAKDGDFSLASFNHPQGVVWLSEDVLFVADTNNHCIRKIVLSVQKVETIASDGDCLKLVENCKILSPWDVAVVEDKLFIAMAGTHQIVVLCLKDNCDVLGKRYSSGSCVVFSGSGSEENRNNTYPRRAAFAQPSGLIYSEWHDCLFVADSESSTIRKVHLKTGAVENVVGGSRDPLNLFAFGDNDATGFDVRLQHPLGIALSDCNEKIFVADSYNHKIKEIDVKHRKCITLAGTGTSGNCNNCKSLLSTFNEPNGLCLLQERNVLLIADTNNHCIKKIDLSARTVSSFDLLFERKAQNLINNRRIIELKSRSVATRSAINIEIELRYENNVVPTSNAPHSITISLSENAIFAVPERKLLIGDFSQPLNLILTPTTDDNDEIIDQEFIAFIDIDVYICDSTNNSCSIRSLRFKQPLRLDRSMQEDSVIKICHMI